MAAVMVLNNMSDIKQVSFFMEECKEWDCKYWVLMLMNLLFTV
jgi:hypothetical protein